MLSSRRSERVWDDNSRTCKWILICARAIDRRNWNIEQAQVYEQLSSMVIPVIEQERSQDRGSGRREQLSFTGHESPRCRRALVAQTREIGSRTLDAGCERLQELP